MATAESLDFIDATHVRVRGKPLLYLAGCNYLGLSRHPRLLEAMRRAIDDGFLHRGASRSTTGEHDLYQQAELALAGFFKQPAAAMLAAGYLAPIAAFQALKHEATHVLLDDAAHPCVADGAAVSGLKVQRFPHGKTEALRKLVGKLPANARPILACDGLLGAKGTLTPLKAYHELLPAKAWFLVDDAHGAGTIGPDGRGAAALFGLKGPQVVQTISLSKSFGLQGGAVLGARSLIARLKNSAGAYVGNTSPLLPTAAAVAESVRVIQSEPWRLEQLRRNLEVLNESLPSSHEGIHHHPASPVLSMTPASENERKRLREELLKAAIYPSWIQYLSGPASGFYRFAITSDHTEAEVRGFAEAIGKAFRG